MSEKITITSGGIGAVFCATTQFRWALVTRKINPFYFPDTTVVRVLQQMHQGSDGTQKWIDVPEVDMTGET